MKKLKPFLLLFAALLFASCQQRPEEAGRKLNDPVVKRIHVGKEVDFMSDLFNFLILIHAKDESRLRLYDLGPYEVIETDKFTSLELGFTPTQFELGPRFGDDDRRLLAWSGSQARAYRVNLTAAFDFNKISELQRFSRPAVINDGIFFGASGIIFGGINPNLLLANQYWPAYGETNLNAPTKDEIRHIDENGYVFAFCSNQDSLYIDDNLLLFNVRRTKIGGVRAIFLPFVSPNRLIVWTMNNGVVGIDPKTTKPVFKVEEGKTLNAFTIYQHGGDMYTATSKTLKSFNADGTQAESLTMDRGITMLHALNDGKGLLLTQGTDVGLIYPTSLGKKEEPISPNSAN